MTQQAEEAENEFIGCDDKSHCTTGLGILMRVQLLMRWQDSLVGEAVRDMICSEKSVESRVCSWRSHLNRTRQGTRSRRVDRCVTTLIQPLVFISDE